MADIINMNAPAATNPVTAGYLGRVMVHNGVANEAVLSGAAGATEADRPIGICVATPEDRIGGRIAICVAGICEGIVGAAGLTKGAQTTVRADDVPSGALITSPPGEAVWTVGTWLPEAETTAAAGSMARILVNVAIDNT